MGGAGNLPASQGKMATTDRPSPPAASGLLTPWRLRMYPLAGLIGLALGFAIYVSTFGDTEQLVDRLGGDYPAFYAAGRIVAAGDAEELYSGERQIAEQQGLLSGREEGLGLPFVYPPFVAAAYAPLALLPYRASYVVYTLLLCLAVVGSVALLRGCLPWVGRYPFAMALLALTFLPFFSAVTGGQNTAVTLLIFAAGLHFAWRGQDLAAGACLGLLFYKPQFAVIFLGLFVLARRWRIAGGMLLTAALLYAAGAAVSGWDWPLRWQRSLAAFLAANQDANPEREVSWLGVSQALLGQGAPLALALGGGAALATAAGLAWAFWAGRFAGLPLLMGLAVAGALLIPPHVMPYDVGLLLLPVAVLAERWKAAVVPLVLLLWVGAFSAVYTGEIGACPLHVLVVIVLALTAREVYRAERARRRDEPRTK